jgi:hypothetical protein
MSMCEGMKGFATVSAKLIVALWPIPAAYDPSRGTGENDGQLWYCLQDLFGGFFCTFVPHIFAAWVADLVLLC